MTDDGWVMVRLRRETHAALRALAARLEEARVQGHPALQTTDRELSIDALISRLVRHHKNDARRKKESRQRIARRRGRKEESIGG